MVIHLINDPYLTSAVAGPFPDGSLAILFPLILYFGACLIGSTCGDLFPPARAQAANCTYQICY